MLMTGEPREQHNERTQERPRGNAALARRIGVEVGTDVGFLQDHVTGWRELAARSLVPNVFYEPFMLLYAAREMRGNAQLLFVFVFEEDHSGKRLIGFFPLERRRRYKGFPLSYLRLWEYSHCYLCNPLLDRRRANSALHAFLDWLAEDQRSSPLMEFGTTWGEGPFHQLLVDVFRARGTLAFLAEQWTRAFFVRRSSSDEYLEHAFSPDKRRDLNRKQRRLAGLGKLEFRNLTRDQAWRPWIDNFLHLEASGWKGQKGTALACQSDSRAFFPAMTEHAFEEGKLFMQGLYLDGKPIAMRCNFTSGPGSFFLKPAYDESFARFSPGVLVERETIREIHNHPTVQWMDSCTSPENGLLNSMWLDRHTLQSVLIATNRGAGRLFVSLLPLLRWLNRALGRYRPSTLETR